jgi:DNA-binding MarR family transcriptional regulator
MDENSKGIRVVRVIRKLKDTMKKNIGHHFKEMSLTGPQGMLMGTLAHYGEMKISDLSEKLGLSNSTVSGIIDRLEKQGLVERIRSKEDRRVVYVNVTEEFKRNAQEHFKEIERRFEEMLSEASTEELDKILDGLDTLEEVICRQKEKNI